MKFKFITLNIEHGGQLMNDIILFLKKEDADVVFIQEAQSTEDSSTPQHFNTLKTFDKTLNYPYSLFSPQLEVILEDHLVKHGNAIYSKFPLKSLEPIFFDIPYGRIDHFANKQRKDFSQIPQSIQRAMLQLNDQLTIDLFNLHGIWGQDGKDSARRLQMSETIINAIKTSKNCILAGDFNVQPNTQTIKNIETYLNSAFKSSLASTFNMKRKTDPGYATAAVDMIFVSSSIKVLSAICPPVEISDHLPLVCELEL